MPATKDLPNIRPVPGKKGMYMDEDSPKAGNPVGSMFEILDGLREASQGLQETSADVNRSQASARPPQASEG